MHAVAENSTTAIPSENGATKVNKKKNRNNKKHKNSEPAPPPEVQNVRTEKSLNNCTKNGTIANGQIKVKNADGKLDGECPDVKVNGCAKSEQDHGVENGEVTAVASSKKSRSRNQRKKRQKNAQNCLENGENKVNEETNAGIEVSNEIINSNNNNIGDKGLANDSDVIENGPDNCLGSITELNHIQETISEASPPTSPESKSQSKSSPSASSKSSSSFSSSSSKIAISSSLPSEATPPQPSSSSSSRQEEQSSTCNEQTRNSPENQGLDLDKTEKKEETSNVSPAVEPVAGPSTEEEGAVGGVDSSNIVIEYKQYESELQMQDIMRLIQSELSEPYSIYTYRYFIYNWPKLCFLAAHGDEYVGAIVCKLDMHMNVRRGYIAMLAVKKEYRKMKIGTTLVEKAIEAMLEDGADEVVLETEMKNTPALRLYENLGFVRDKRLFRYYLNGVDALRLKLWFR